MFTSKSRRRRRDHLENEENDQNRWMISYADFSTLLFAFFVVMYALSNINIQKYRAFADSAQAAFSKSPIKNPTKNITELEQTFPGLNPTPRVLANVERSDMEVQSTSFFSMGSATLTDNAKEVLTNLAQKLKDKPYLVTVEGHTDNQPIINSYFKSNWELSAARAAAVTHFLSKTGVASQHLTAVGYGEEFPIADNSTEEGRLKNRRVVIVISPNQYRTRSYLSPKQQAEAILAKQKEQQQDKAKQAQQLLR